MRLEVARARLPSLSDRGDHNDVQIKKSGNVQLPAQQLVRYSQLHRPPAAASSCCGTVHAYVAGWGGGGCRGGGGGSSMQNNV